MIEWGFRLPWEGPPAPLKAFPPIFRLPASQEACQVLEQEISALVLKEAVEEISSQAVSPGFYGRLFCVPKRSGGYRPVLDLSPLNVYLKKVHFRMETVGSIRAAIRPGDWATSIDLRDAYFHVLIHRRYRKWLRFVWKGKIFQFRALPFGLSLAPWVFTRITREICVVAHSRGIRLLVYLDDWLILATSQMLSNNHSVEVVSIAQGLGFMLNREKCALTPSQSFTYLGMKFNTVSMLVSPTQERIDRFISLRDKLLSRSHSTARSIAALLGQMESLAPLVPLGQVHKRELQRQFRDRWCQARQSWDTIVPLHGWLQKAIQQWMVDSWLHQGVPISYPVPQVELYTDASRIGWGAHVADLTASGRWSQDLQTAHINFLEMRAVSLAIKAFAHFLKGKAVLLFTDNTTVACYVNKGGGSHSATLSREAESLLILCQDLGIVLKARHVAGKVNILADFLSRPGMILQTEWTLAHNVLQPVWSQWHKPLIDLFATQFSRRLQMYVSPVPDPGALGTDALSMSWVGLTAYAFPPIQILSRVIKKARIDGPCLILIAPLWPAQLWYPELLELTEQPPLKLSVGRKGLVQPRSGIPHPNPDMLCLHAWLVCGNGCVH